MVVVRRPAIVLLCAVACALLVLPASGAAADPTSRSRQALLAQERYLMSLGAADTATEPSPEERYYSSYGSPDPLAAPQDPEPSAGTPWPLLAAIAGAGAVVLLGTGRLRRRLVLPGRRARIDPRRGAA